MIHFTFNRQYILLLICSLVFVTCSGCKPVSSSEDSPDTTDTEEATPSPLDGLVIYEVNPRFYGENGLFREISKDLPRIKSIGANVLWLMPIQTPGEVKSIGSPYSIRDYISINPRYGTPDDLHELIKAAHSLNMKVFIDWVANHTSWDHTWITTHPEWYSQDASGNIKHPDGTNWLDVADLDYDKSPLRQAMMDAMLYWVKEYNVDGFRCDYAEGVPLDFWRSTVETLKKHNPKLLMLAEGGKSELFNAGFDLVYGWGAYAKLASYYTGKGRLRDFLDSVQEETKSIDQSKHQRLRYITNHDIMSETALMEVFKTPEAALSALALSSLIDGVPLIYSSQELAPSSRLSFFTYQTLDLASESSFSKKQSEILALYASTVSLRRGKRQIGATDGVVTVTYQTDDKNLLIQVNTTGSTKSVNTPISLVRRKAKSMTDQSEITLPSEMTLKPYQYSVYVT